MAPPSMADRSGSLKPVLSGHAPIGEAAGAGADEDPGTTDLRSSGFDTNHRAEGFSVEPYNRTAVTLIRGVSAVQRKMRFALLSEAHLA
jgi:hypothetical protein